MTTTAAGADTVTPRRPRFTPEELAKLPQWARRKIEPLQADLAYAHERLAQGPEDSRVFADPYSEVPRPLGDAAVEFVLDPSLGHAGRIRVRLMEDGLLDLNGTGRGLVVMPSASNTVQIGLAPR